MKPSGDATKKPKGSLGFISLDRLLADAVYSLRMGDIGLEPTTSTMSTCESINGNPAKRWGKRKDPERLHQCLHQIGEWIENYGTESLADALVQLLGNESFEELSDALGRRVIKG